MRSFQSLKVWDKPHRLTLDIYETTAAFPREELHGLSSQILRSCSSIPANIAEGRARHGRLELARFLQIAMGSANELEYHLLLARVLRMLDNDAYGRLCSDLEQIKRMLAAYLSKIRSTTV